MDACWYARDHSLSNALGYICPAILRYLQTASFPLVGTVSFSAVWYEVQLQAFQHSCDANSVTSGIDLLQQLADRACGHEHRQ